MYRERVRHTDRGHRKEKLRETSYGYDQVAVFFIEVEKQFDAERMSFEINDAGALDIHRQMIIVMITYKQLIIQTNNKPLPNFTTYTKTHPKLIVGLTVIYSTV